jgi:hypothetical protein
LGFSSFAALPGFAFALMLAASPLQASQLSAGQTQNNQSQGSQNQGNQNQPGTRPERDGQYLYFKPSPALTAPTLFSPSPALGATGSEIKRFTPALTDSRNRRRPNVSTSRDVSTRGQNKQSSITFTPAAGVVPARNISLTLASEVGAPSELGLSMLRSAAEPKGSIGLSPAFFKEPATAYAVNLGVGYRGFKLQAGVNQIATPTSALANGIDLGLSYQGKDWKTSLHVMSQDYRFDGVAAPLPNRFSAGRSTALEVGGAYQITPRVALTGSMRYAITEPNTAFGVSLRQPHSGATTREAASIYLGTALDF